MRAVLLAHETDWDGWRRATRALVLANVAADQIVWSVRGEADLLAEPAPLPVTQGTFNVPRGLVELGETAIQAREPERFAWMYRLVLRAHRGERHILENVTDPEVQRVHRLGQAVRRDTHKMRAFLRFRSVEENGTTRYIAWFEPSHYIVEANAPFFVRRFATMTWSILTPYRSAHWDGANVTFEAGAEPADVPDDDALEGYWRAYFSSIFNPARLKVGAMQSEMPKKYWRNLPEAAAIPDLIRSAFSRTEQMLEQEMRPPKTMPLAPVRARAAQAGTGAPGAPLAALAEEAAGCRNCPLWEPATQTVFGEGPANARMMLIGEQPGDQEDLIGRPFVGPAGQLLDRALEEAGIDRQALYVTNAVKHFKFVPRGKRRIHAKPDMVEIAACSPWLSAEREAVKPGLLVLMGATAARAVLGRAVTITRERGRRIVMEDGQAAFVTVHPSFLLRLPDEQSKQREYRAFVKDLMRAAEIAAESVART
jgi:DNA polymerase